MAEEKTKKDIENTQQSENIQNAENDMQQDLTAEEEKEQEQPEVEKNENEEKEKASQVTQEEQIEKLQARIDEFSDKHLRLQAEFDNFRRRTIREKADLIKAGGESVIINLLPVIDDFERALDSLQSTPDDDAGKLGTVLIYSKFKDFLKQNNVKEIDAKNKDFDVDLHEAITKIPAPDKKHKGKVVDVIQKGYTLNDKVIRFAKVVIGE